MEQNGHNSALSAVDLRKENDRLCYSGRIAWDKKDEPTFVWPATSLSFRFRGDASSVTVYNNHYGWINFIGFVVDKKQTKVRIADNTNTTIELPIEGYGEHEVIIYKPSDNYEMTIKSLQISGELLDAPFRASLRMEVYGDSVSAGEVVEALDYVGMTDPENEGDGVFSNSWYAWSWQCARLLDAELFDIAQGGIPLLRGTGWWHENEYYGMEDIWDKVHFNPSIHEVTDWDFSLYTPDVVVVALGQNDSNPDDFMKNDPDGEKAANWKRHYEAFIKKLREKYPDAHIICMTTILEHDVAWDEAIDEVVGRLSDAKVSHFLFSRNGCGTPGHPRIPEQEEMAREISEYIRQEIIHMRQSR